MRLASYSLRTDENVIARLLELKTRLITCQVNLEDASETSVREARETGTEAGYWTARRVNTIWHITVR